MSSPLRTVGWIDLTVDEATSVKDFYRSVIGWEESAVDMGTYDDFCLHAEPGGEPIVGICHRQGQNSNIPPVWLVYFMVDQLDAALARCQESGGSVLAPIRDMGVGKMAIIRDPAGAVCALYEST